MPLKQIAHYRVNRLLGAGGMGEVYLAEDDKLQRKVALKILPERFAAEHERVRRFEREARAASALNHPNIITIYEIGVDDGRHYIATEYIEGVTLRERIASPEPITIGEILDVAAGVANALAAAHEAGIVHRDIKPENVMLRPDGYVKVLDFGLAKNIDTKDTSSGALMGTLLYISPEQVRGGTPDARSDIYSLGVVLYELLTRTPPHTGENIVQLAMAISNDDVHPPSALSPGLPPELDRIVCKALEKDVSKRYQTSRALLDDLRTLRQELEFENKLVRTSTPVLAHQRTELLSMPLGTTSRVIGLWKTRPWIRWASVSVIVLAVIATALLFLRKSPFAAGRIDSVAVMPFTNATGSPDNAYLSDGIAESIIDSLSQLPELHVLARSTTFSDQLRKMDPLAAGRELKVEGVVTGHVRQRGDTIIVRASLVDVRDGTNVWGQQYEGKVSNVLALQQTMAQEISRNLRMQLTGEEKELLARRTSVNPEAFQSYLKGRYQLYKYTEDSIRKSIDLFHQCIEIDPTYPLPYAGLADAYYGLSNIYMSPHEAMPRAREAAGRALQLDESLAQAHTALAMVLVWYDWDFARGEAEFRRAIALEPDDAEAHRQYNTFLTAVGRFDEALAIGRKAIELDALSVPASYALARTYYFAGRYPEAKQQLRATSELNDRFAQVYNLEALIAVNEGRPADAVERVNQALAVGGRTPLYLSTWGYVHARLGNRDAAVKAMTELKSRVTYTPPVVMARLHTALGENDEAIRLLDQSVKDRSESIVWMKVDPSFAPLQKDARYGELLKRVGY